MPKVSFADLMRDWERLISAAENNGAASGDFEPYLSALRLHFAYVQDLKARQDAAAASRRALTQKLEEGTVEGKALAMSLRGAVRARFGAYDAGLVEFGMRPVRRRGSGVPGRSLLAAARGEAQPVAEDETAPAGQDEALPVPLGEALLAGPGEAPPAAEMGTGEGEGEAV
jgi:hypothetical protein